MNERTVWESRKTRKCQNKQWDHPLKGTTFHSVAHPNYQQVSSQNAEILQSEVIESHLPIAMRATDEI